MKQVFCACFILCGTLLSAIGGDAQPTSSEALWKKLEPFAQPPEEFAGKFGSYRSPLKFNDGSMVKTPVDWTRRREEISKTWKKRLGAWPPLVERPVLKKLTKVERDGYTEYKVQVQVSPKGKWVDGYLLIPNGKGPFPAVVVPFYEPLTSIGRGVKGRGVGTHDYGLQLVKRGFVTLSIGTPGSLDKLGGDTRDALIKTGEESRRQPLTMLAYVAANCLSALAQLPEVDAARIGIIGLSYGGKWSMFASCLDARFACAVWSDPGIVFNEKDANVNYWEPWYLGFDPKLKRKPGIPSQANPRTGLYKELIDAGDDLVDLHALMAPRPVLVSGGVQDPPKNWQALNHLVAVNQLLGHKNRAFLTARKTHVPTPEALQLELAFLEYFLKPAPSGKGKSKTDAERSTDIQSLPLPAKSKTDAERSTDIQSLPLPANTWVEIKYTVEQPNDQLDEKGQWRPVGWNKLVYDPDGKRVLFYDRWVDKKHGGLTIYGNCLFAFDPATAKVKPIKIDHWTKVSLAKGGYRTVALPENDKEPTPCPRHVYHGFTYVPDLKAVFISNGANQSAMLKDGKLVGHDLCSDTWRLDLKSNQWTKIDAAGSPPNRLDDAMAYCPDTRSIIYTGTGCQMWILDLEKKQWRKAKQSPPQHGSMGRTIFYDPSQKRMLVTGGGALDAWSKGKAPEFRELYAFDPRTELVTRLADAPTALYSSHLAYDSKRQLFVAVAVFNKQEQPSGMFCYSPKKDAWQEIKPANPIPPHKSWMGWMKLCYDAQHDCFIGMISDKLFAFRYEPTK